MDLSKRPYMNNLKVMVIILFFCGLIACADSKSDTAAGSGEIETFTEDLQKSLPHPGTPVENSSRLNSYKESYESYDEAVLEGEGGMFDKVFGDGPTSTFFMVGTVDKLITEILNAEDQQDNILKGASAELTLPFFGDAVSVDRTFSYNGTFASTVSLDGTAYTFNFTVFEGGYTSNDIFVAAIRVNFDIGKVIDCSIIFYGQRDSSGRLTVKLARYETEGSETDIGHAQFYFNRDSEDAPFQYKCVAQSSDDEKDDVFSIIGAGTLERLVMRRRSCGDTDEDELIDSFIDQYYVADYDSSTGEFADDPVFEDSSTDAFDIDGDGFTGTGGLGNIIDIPAEHGMDAYEADIHAADMWDFSEPTTLPADREAVTPDWDI